MGTKTSGGNEKWVHPQKSAGLNKRVSEKQAFYAWQNFAILAKKGKKIVASLTKTRFRKSFVQLVEEAEVGIGNWDGNEHFKEIYENKISAKKGGRAATASTKKQKRSESAAGGAILQKSVSIFNIFLDFVKNVNSSR